MKHLRQLIKDISLLLTNSMIVYTLALSPLVLNTQVAIAEDSKDKKDEECKEEKNEDGSPGVYKPGCKFDDALADVNENPGGKGIKGMIEQFVGIAFASAAVSSIIFKHTERSQLDCPQNKNANITLRMMQAGALAYLLGEMKAKAEFKKASKLATDATFVPKAKLAENAGDDTINKRNREENNKQLEAYETLIKVYEHKVKGIQTKKNLAMVAELAYLGALGTELVMTMGHKAKCSADESGYSALFETIRTGLGASQTTAAGNVTAWLVPIPPAVTPTPDQIAKSELCATAASNLTSLITAHSTGQAADMADGASDGADADMRSTADSGFITGIFNTIKSSFTGGSFKIDPTDISLEAELARERARSSRRESSDEAREAQERTSWEITAASCNACLVPPSGVPGGCGGFSSARAQDVANDRRPVQCCGASALTLVTGADSVPNPSRMDKEVDIFIQKIPVIGTNQIEFIKPAILNTIEQYYYAKLMKEMNHGAPGKTVAKLSSFYTYLNLLEENFDDEIQNSREFKLYQKRINEEFEESKSLALLDELKLSLIEDAHAINFMSILGFGAKLFMMNKILGKFMRNKGLVKPRSRMYTFGAMGAVNGAIVLFEGKKLAENKKHLEIVKAEKERFEKSHAMQTGLAHKSGSESGALDGEGMIRIGEGEGSNYLALTKNKGVMACAVPAEGKSFAPAPCPQVLPKSFLSELNTSEKGNAQVTPFFRQFPSLVATTTASAASGDDLNNPEVFGANLKALQAKRGALQAEVDKLVKDYDDLEKGKAKNQKSKAGPLARALANIQKTFSGTPVGSSSAALAALPTNDLSQDDEDKKDPNFKSGSTTASVPNFKMPDVPSGGSDFDFGSDDSFENADVQNGGSRDQSLSDFVVDNGDIVEKPEANIFQLINNRYLRSYPVLLEEVESAETGN